MTQIICTHTKRKHREVVAEGALRVLILWAVAAIKHKFMGPLVVVAVVVAVAVQGMNRVILSTVTLRVAVAVGEVLGGKDNLELMVVLALLVGAGLLVMV
jgi:hypothetical protein